MNLLLLEPGELAADGTARLGGRRARHVHEVLRAAAGDTLRAGVVGGAMGTAELLSAGPEEVVLAARLTEPPPPPSPLSLLLALPRPKILRRVLQAVASMGVKRIVLCGSWRVEKAYFASPFLEPAALRAELVLGLEQGRDTLLPSVEVRRLFKPLVEDELTTLLPAPVRLLAHPVGARPLQDLPASGAEATVAIGPEGGFTAYEAGRLEELGFLPFSLGPRVLRVDAAVPCALGQVALWLSGCAPGAGTPGTRG
ncbi:MAG: 16S rRNA (uracil(1498)-N(3))-methyltransferase [Anaeromyxobacter sp.]